MSTRRPLCIVHIGLNKTGSTSIQAWLDMNRDALRAQGIWHDDLGPHGGPHLSTAIGWTVLGHSARGDWMPRGWQRQALAVSSPEDLQDRLTDFLARVDGTLPPPGAGTYVTSSESIGTGLRTTHEIARLHGWFAERFDAVRYVVYLREQADWLASAYVQAIRAGRADSLDAFIDSHGQADYDALVQRWSDVAGAGNVDVRLFDKSRDLIADFAKAIGADVVATARPKRLNDSMPLYQLRLIRGANRLLGPLIADTPLVKIQRSLSNRNLPPLFGAARLELAPEQAARVRAMNAASNERLRARHFPDRPTLFPGVAPDPTEYRPAAPGGTAATPQRQDKRLWPYS
jgi:hypothetical protein